MTDPYYAEAGSQWSSSPQKGTPLVLLHGFCETHHLWDHYLPTLGEEFWVLAPDLPGFGLSTSLPEGFSLSDVADRLAQWLNQLGIEEAVLIGHSLGGYVALAFLEKYPQRVKGIGLFNSTAYADSAEKRKSRNNVIDFVEKYGVETFVTSFVPQLFYPTNRPYLEEQIANVVAQASATAQYSLVAYTRAMQQRPNRLPVLEAYRGPILYIIGEMDGSVPLADSRKQLEHLDNYQAYILEETGHMGMYEQAERSLEILQEFMRSTIQEKSS